MRETAAALVFLAAVGCASGGGPSVRETPATPAAPDSPPPAAVVPSPPPVQPSPSTEPSPPPPASQTPTSADGSTAEVEESGLTVLEIPGRETAPAPPRDLVAAAAAERRRRSESGPATVVIDQDSLSDYADVEITVARAAGATSGDEATDEAVISAEAALALAADDEAYWRSRVRDLRRGWREAHDSIERLEGEIASLRRRFYAEDDPYYRDSQVKPAWDRALEEVRLARREAERFKAELKDSLEEGRRAGALPGWLREGIDLQPESPDFPEADSLQIEETTGIYEPVEPEVRERRRPDGEGEGG